MVDDLVWLSGCKLYCVILVNCCLPRRLIMVCSGNKKDSRMVKGLIICTVNAAVKEERSALTISAAIGLCSFPPPLL